MNKVVLLYWTALYFVQCAERRIIVSDTVCGNTYNAEDENLHFVYHGDKLTDECTLTINKYSEKYKTVCAAFDKALLKSCQTAVELRPSANSVKTYKCDSTDFQEYCKDVDKLTITILAKSLNSDEIDLKIYYKEGDSGAASLGTIVVFVVLAILFVIAGSVFYVRFRQRVKKEKKARKKREKERKKQMETDYIDA